MKLVLDNLLLRYPGLAACREQIWRAAEIMAHSYAEGGKLLIAGNGGSAADAEHIVGELMKSFVMPRSLPEGYADALVSCDPAIGSVLRDKLQGALPALALDGHFALSTAFMNDCDPLLGFAQQVNGYGRPGDVFLGISTSGNSMNVLYAAVAAKARGMKTIGLTGQGGGRLGDFCDECIEVPGSGTYEVQELHLPVYHCLCMMLEKHFFGENI